MDDRPNSELRDFLSKPGTPSTPVLKKQLEPENYLKAFAVSTINGKVGGKVTKLNQDNTFAAEQALTQSEASVTTTYSLINAEIEKAGDLLGDDVDVAAKIVVLKMLIRKVLGRRRRNSMSTSTFIATASFNAGVLVTGALLGKTKKTWYTSRDERVRNTHAALHGRTVDLFESYDTPSGPLRFPGDPLAPPSETINCRCRLRLS